MMTMPRLWLFALVSLVAASAIPLAAAIGDNRREEPPARAEPGFSQRGATAPGIVEPATEERDIAATVTGRLKGPMPEEGQAVAAGAIIAEIENDDLKAELAAAQARVAIRQSERERLLAGARQEERMEAAAELKQAEAQLHLAQKNLGRRQSLVQDGIASIESADGARADYETASARRDLMAARLARVNAPPRSEDVAIADAELAAAQAQVADLEARIEKTRLRSPIAGVILKRYKMPGETVSDLPPTLVAKVGDLSHLRVRAQIDEADVTRVSLGDRVTAKADAFGDQRFFGTVIKIGTRLGPKYLKTDAPGERFDTKVLEAIIALDGRPPLPPGLRVDVFFEPTAQG
jgi:HlyD family secretion protein